MKNLMFTTATALILSTSAYADTHDSPFSALQFDTTKNLNASEMIGMRVYASEASIEGTFTQGDETNWDDIGDINEIVLTRDGDVQSVIVGVGGFLGLGEKDVAISLDKLSFVSEEGSTDDFFLVVKATTVGLKETPAYEAPQVYDAADVDGMTTPDGFEMVDMGDFNAEDLTGARVYSVKDEDIGEISELIMTTSGKIDKAIIDVGGFLGLGENQVAVNMDDLQILRSTDEKALRVLIDATQKSLEEKPEYKG